MWNRGRGKWARVRVMRSEREETTYTLTAVAGKGGAKGKSAIPVRGGPKCRGGRDWRKQDRVDQRGEGGRWAEKSYGRRCKPDQAESVGSGRQGRKTQRSSGKSGWAEEKTEMRWFCSACPYCPLCRVESVGCGGTNVTGNRCERKYSRHSNEVSLSTVRLGRGWEGAVKKARMHAKEETSSVAGRDFGGV
jgi:hypothetical protein